MTPAVSVIMPAFNAERYIVDALRSLQGQAGVALEIIVVDDGSHDRTLDLAKSVARDDPRVVVLAADHGGVSRARNAGLDIARGDFFTFLDADDLCPPDKIARHLAILNREPETTIVVGEMLLFEALGADFAPLPGSRTDRILSVQLSAATFRRAVFDRCGNLDPSFDHGEDLDLFLRVIEAGEPMHIEREIATLYRRHHSNVTNDFKASQRGFLRACHKSLVRRRATGTVLPENPILSHRHEIERNFRG